MRGPGIPIALRAGLHRPGSNATGMPGPHPNNAPVMQRPAHRTLGSTFSPTICLPHSN
jgi:hypothetical protein